VIDVIYLLTKFNISNLSETNWVFHICIHGEKFRLWTGLYLHVMCGYQCFQNCGFCQ
jgi:hypothetical protein